MALTWTAIPSASVSTAWCQVTWWRWFESAVDLCLNIIDSEICFWLVKLFKIGKSSLFLWILVLTPVPQHISASWKHVQGWRVNLLLGEPIQFLFLHQGLNGQFITPADDCSFLFQERLRAPAIACTESMHVSIASVRKLELSWQTCWGGVTSVLEAMLMTHQQSQVLLMA